MLTPIRIPRPPAAGAGNPVTEWRVLWQEPPYVEHFYGETGGSLPAPWTVTDVSAAGSPTTDYQENIGGDYILAMDATDEAQQLHVDWNDALMLGKWNVLDGLMAFSWQFSAYPDNADSGNWRVGHRMMVGIGSAYNANLDSIQRYCRLACDGDNDILIETDDNATVSSTDTGENWNRNAIYTLTIVLNPAETQVEYYLGKVEDPTIAPPSMLYLGAHTFAATFAYFQPMAAIQKASGGYQDSLTLETFSATMPAKYA